MILDNKIVLELANQALENASQKEEVKPFCIDQANKAIQHWDSNKNEDAIIALSKALDILPTLNVLLILKSLIYCSSKNTIDSHKLLGLVKDGELSKQELNMKEYIVSCNYLHDKEYSDSIEVANKIIQREPKAYYAYLPRAISYQELEQYKKSISDFKIALKEKLQIEGVKAGLAFSYMKNKNYVYALVLHLKVIKHFRNNFRVNHNIGINYFMLHLNSKALKHVNKSIELKKDFADGYRTRGLIYLTQRKKKMALAQLMLAKKYGAKNIEQTLARFEQKLK